MKRRTVLGMAATGLVAATLNVRFRPSDTNQNIAQAQRHLMIARRQAGLQVLAPHPVLETMSQAQTTFMRSIGQATHLDALGNTPKRRATRLGYRKQILGETLAETYGPGDETIAYWLAHTATRSVLMDPRAREFGLAMTPDADGRMWWAAVVADL